jgi:hypothetical protein
LRNLLWAGGAGLFLTLGAAAAYAVPQNSPYATMVPPSAVDGYDNSPAYGNQDYGYESGPMAEGRSTYMAPEYGYDDPVYASDYGYSAPLAGRSFSAARGGHFGSGGGHFGRWTFHR